MKKQAVIKRLLTMGLALSLVIQGEGAVLTARASELAETQQQESTVESGWDGTAATAFAGGTGTKEDPYQISNAAELEYLAEQSNQIAAVNKKVFEGVYFILTDDIDLNGQKFTPIGKNYTAYFAGSFDGNGKTITVTDAEGNHGFTQLAYYAANEAVFKNFTIEGNDKMTKGISAIISSPQGNTVIQNIVNKAKLSGSMINGSATLINCINYGEANNSVFVNMYGGALGCINYGDVTGAGAQVGAIATRPNIGDIVNCVNMGDVTSTSTSSSSYVGGIIGDARGQLNSSTGNGQVIAGNINTGKVSGGAYAGGIAGNLSNSNGEIYGNWNQGEVSGASRYSGGIVGNRSTDIMFCGNLNTGKVDGGAIIGYYTSYSASTKMAANYYLKTSASNAIGGMRKEVEFDDKAMIAVDDLAAITAEDAWNMNTGAGTQSNKLCWSYGKDGLIHVNDPRVDEVAGICRMVVKAGDHVKVLLDDEVQEDDTIYFLDGKEITVSVDDKYTMTSLVVNGESISLKAGQKTYTFTPEGSDVEISVKTKVVSAYQLKKAILALSDEGITTESGDTIQELRARYDALSKEEQESVGETAERVLADAEKTYAYLQKFAVTLKKDSYSYTGKALKPEVVSVVYNGDTEPVTLDAADYTAAYQNNTKPGTGKVLVTLGGAYTSGTLVKNFTIQKLDIQKAKITLSYTSAKHTGKALKPAVTVKNGSSKLTSGKDYQVTYQNNTKPGTAKVVVKGIGNYKGSVTKTFVIKAAKGKTYEVGFLKYRVTNESTSKGTVTVTAVSSKKVKEITVPSSVKIGKYSYQVTAIGEKAFSGCKSLTKAVVGSNVTTIGKQAFANDAKLKTITIKSSKLKSVGASAFKGIHEKAVIKVPAKKLAAYKKLLAKKGQKSTVTIKK